MSVKKKYFPITHHSSKFTYLNSTIESWLIHVYLILFIYFHILASCLCPLLWYGELIVYIITHYVSRVFSHITVGGEEVGEQQND